MVVAAARVFTAFSLERGDNRPVKRPSMAAFDESFDKTYAGTEHSLLRPTKDRDDMLAEGRPSDKGDEEQENWPMDMRYGHAI